MVKPGVGIEATGNTRIEEGSELVLVPDDRPGRRDEAGLSLARYVRSGSAWQRDWTFKARRAGM